MIYQIILRGVVMKKLIKLFISSVLIIIGSISLMSCNSNVKIKDSNNELIGSIVDLAVENAKVKIDDYVDLNYFANLKKTTSMMVDNIQLLSKKAINNETDDIDEIQYKSLTSSISEIFNDLSAEEYNVFQSLAKDNSDIAKMLVMIENNFEETINLVNSNKNRIKTSNVITLSSGVLAIEDILRAQQVCTSAIISIKGAFNSMISSLKAFFVPNALKTVIITTSILVISSVVIINWDKIKPVFNKIVNIFINNAKKLANTVTKVFNSIYQTAVKTELKKDVAADATSQNQMQKQVERGQAPKEVDRVDRSHTKYGQDHVHFKDGSAINKDGTIHDDGHGVPKLTNKILDWLNSNGWCLNGLKN